MMQLQVLTYIALGVFAVVITAKAIKYFRMPLHLRWELYPVPHERGKEYGGSYFENLNWWTKPMERSFFAPIKFLMIEILFVKSLFHDNRKLWFVSYPFHLGLYLLITCLGLMIIGAIANVAGVYPLSGFSIVVRSLVSITGMAGFVIGSIGCIGLFMRRTFNSDLRAYSGPKDYFNLLFILAIFVSGIIAYNQNSQAFAIYQGYFQSLITGSDIRIADSALSTHIILLSAFGIYLPFTHMTHFLGKYFLWDKTRWDDRVNLKGSKIEAQINQLLTQKLDWSAPHIEKGKNWVENATKEMNKDEN